MRAVIRHHESEPYTWQDLIEDPIDIAMRYMDDLPAGVYSSRSSYPVDQFTFSEKAQKDLATYTKLTDGGQITHVRFGADLVEQARLLGATHEASRFSIILGDDVASRLAEDYIAAVVKEARARQRRQRDAQRTSTAGSASATGDLSVDGAAAGEPESEAERAQREQPSRIPSAPSSSRGARTQRGSTSSSVCSCSSTCRSSRSMSGCCASGRVSISAGR